MRAWEFEGVGLPLQLIEKPDPVAKSGYVVIETKAAGVCGSDVHSCTMDSWVAYTQKGCVIGHEIAGVIKELGEGVTGFEVGDRVCVCPSNAEDGSFPGSLERDGGFSTMHLAPVESLVRVPDNVDFAKAASCGCECMTPYHALYDAAGIQPGMTVGIIGIGGLGQVAVRLAVLEGCDVYASSRKKSARDIATSLGCKGVVEKAADLADYNCDAIIDFAGAGDTTADAVEAVGFQGKVVLVGMGADYTTLNTMTMVAKQLTVITIDGGTKEGMQACMDLMASGELDPAYTVIDFEQMNEAINMHYEGDKRGRIVAVIA